MPVSLIKESFVGAGNNIPALSDTMKNREMLTCSQCKQRYTFGWSDAELSHLPKWKAKAEQAINESHPEHNEQSLQLT